jgi:hypothetical protein
MPEYCTKQQHCAEIDSSVGSTGRLSHHGHDSSGWTGLLSAPTVSLTSRACCKPAHTPMGVLLYIVNI